MKQPKSPKKRRGAKPDGIGIAPSGFDGKRSATSTDVAHRAESTAREHKSTVGVDVPPEKKKNLTGLFRLPARVDVPTSWAGKLRDTKNKRLRTAVSLGIKNPRDEGVFARRT